MATGDPIGDDLCSGTTNGNTLPELPSWESREITFGSSYELISSTKYAIVVRATSGDAEWIIETPSGYANGNKYLSTSSGLIWTTEPTIDCWFKTKALTIEKDTNTPIGEDYWEDIYTTRWSAQTFTASSTYTITSVVLKLGRWSGTTPGTLTVSIKLVEGSGPTKPTNPTPTNAADNVTLDQQTISWENGGGATSYDVYYGTTSGNLTLLESDVTDTEYTIFQIDDGSPFDYEVTRYWRIDAVNAAGTTTGDEWSFTTIVFKIPAVGPRGFGGGGGEADGFGGGAIADGQINLKTRLIAITKNTFFYEDV